MARSEIYQYLKGALAFATDSEAVVRKAVEEFGSRSEATVKYYASLLTKSFDAEAMAACLSGRDLFNERFHEELETARRNGLVVVTGYSDDLLEIDGAISGECDCFEGGLFHLAKDAKGVWELIEEEGRNYILAKWYDKKERDEYGMVIPWTYETDIPHADFMANFDGDMYCRGFVFRVDDLVR